MAQCEGLVDPNKTYGDYLPEIKNSFYAKIKIKDSMNMMARDNKIASYSQVNADIFIQPELVDANIDSYIASSYADIRQIYSNQTYEDTLWTSRQ